MGAGFPFRMKMLWNRMEVVDAEYHECTKDPGTAYFKKVNFMFSLRFFKKRKTATHPAHVLCSGSSCAWSTGSESCLACSSYVQIPGHKASPKRRPPRPPFIYLLTFWPPISPGRRKFPDQGSNLRHSINLSHSDNARSLCYQGSNPL